MPDAADEADERTADLGETQLDLDRQRRCGFPEAIFGEGKTTDTLARIVARLIQASQPVLITRIAPDSALALLSQYPLAVHNPVARTLRLPRPSPASPPIEASPSIPASPPLTSAPPLHSNLPPRTNPPRVAVITAGTTDQPVAEEVRETLAWMEIASVLIQDVGVAGPHRLPARLAEFHDADAIVVVAGMEGALPSVVGGYVSCPVIAVPTSVGYGASFGGLAALLGMLNSCAANVAVVNIDAGFKAGYLAGLIASSRTIDPR